MSSAASGSIYQHATVPCSDSDFRVTVFNSFDAARAAWSRIEALADGYAFQSYDWLSMWFDTCAQPDLRICIVNVDGADESPLMLLPLAIEKRAGTSCLIFPGGALTDYQAPILARTFSSQITLENFSVLWSAIRNLLPPHNAIFFEKQPEYVGSQKNPFISLDCRPHASSAHQSHLKGNFNNFLANTRSKKTLSTERRKRKKLEQSGTLAFEVADGPDAARHILSTMMRQKSESFRELGVVDLLAARSYRDFIERLSMRHVANGFVHLCALRLNDKIIAAHWGLVYKNRLYYLLPSHEHGELARLSPGNILLHHLFEWCFENGIAICDFTVGDEPYKLSWRDTELKLFDLMQSNTISGYRYILPLRIKRKLKYKTKRSPTLSKMFYALRSGKARLARQLGALWSAS